VMSRSSGQEPTTSAPLQTIIIDEHN